MKCLSCANGDLLPALGLGTWKSSPGEVYEAVRHAIKLGYRHIDCASVYANEKEIGRALFDVIRSKEVSREQLWITSKLWNDSHKQDDVRPALEQSLSDLQLDYLDAFLIHWPVAFKRGREIPRQQDDYYSQSELPISETWHAMEECAKSGHVRHIGVSNFSVSKLQSIISTSTIAPSINQVELHPLLTQTKLKRFCDSNQILLTAFSPLGSRDRASNFKSSNEPDLFELEPIKAIAGERNITPAQVLIAWAVCRGTSAIPKSVNPRHMEANLQAQTIEFDATEMHLLNGLNRHYRYVNGGFFAGKNSPYTIGGIWDE